MTERSWEHSDECGWCGDPSDARGICDDCCYALFEREEDAT